MKIAPRQIANFLAKPPDQIRAILLHGSDVGLRSSRARHLATLYSDNLDDVFSVTRISGSGLHGEAGKIADAAAEIAMFGTRLILVKATGTELLDACKFLLSRPIHDAMVIIDASDTTTKHAVVKLFETTENAAAIGCYHDNIGDIRQLTTGILQEDNVSVDRDALDLICARLGNDHATTRAELEKLALLAGPGGHLNRETISAALGDSALITIDDIASAVANGQVPALSVALRKAWLEEANCVMIIRGCQTYFNQLRMLGHAISTGQPAQNAVRGLRPPVHFKLQDALIRHTQKWQPSRCIKMINRLQDIEMNIKSKPIDDRTLTAQSLLGLCLRARQ
jgi:DNA polymerase III subunit delta